MGEITKKPPWRPTKLTEETVAKAEAYVEKCIEGLQEILVSTKNLRNGETQDYFAPRLPNTARMAIECGIHKVTLYDWIKPHDGDDEETAKLRARFSNCVTYVDTVQEAELVEEGGAGKLNPVVVRCILAARHRYVERKDITSDDKPITGNAIVFATFSNDDDDGGAEGQP